MYLFRYGNSARIEVCLDAGCGGVLKLHEVQKYYQEDWSWLEELVLDYFKKS